MLGMFVVAIGLLLGFPGVFVAIGLFIDASRTKRHHRGFIVGTIASLLALVSIMLTSPTTIFALSSWAFFHRHAERGEIVFAVAFLALQVLIALLAARTAVRHRRAERIADGPPASPSRAA